MELSGAGKNWLELYASVSGILWKLFTWAEGKTAVAQHKKRLTAAMLFLLRQE